MSFDTNIRMCPQKKIKNGTSFLVLAKSKEIAAWLRARIMRMVGSFKSTLSFPQPRWRQVCVCVCVCVARMNYIWAVELHWNVLHSACRGGPSLGLRRTIIRVKIFSPEIEVNLYVIDKIFFVYISRHGIIYICIYDCDRVKYVKMECEFNLDKSK